MRVTSTRPILWLATVFVACVPPPSDSTVERPAPAPEDPFAVVFRDGRTLRYRLVRDEPALGAHRERAVECTLAARALGVHRVARLSCGDVDVVSGRLVVNQRGLWIVGGEPADDAAAARMVDSEPAFFPFPLAETNREGTDWERVVRRAGAWCKEWGEASVPQGEVQTRHALCVTPGIGITSVEHVRREPDGSQSRERFELVHQSAARRHRP